MNTLKTENWSTHTLDLNFNELEIPYSEATLIIDGKSIYIKGDKETVKSLITLISINIKEEILH